jgi:hypothetical protein
MKLEKPTHIASQPRPEPLTLQERYELKTGMPREEFVGHLLTQTLYLHARFLLPILPSGVFSMDRALLDVVGRCRTRRDLSEECKDFLFALNQQPIWKRVLRLRVSVGRLHDVADRVW